MYWAIRRDEVCDPVLGCPKANDLGEHLDTCNLIRLDQDMMRTGAGQLLQRAFQLRSAKGAGVGFSSDEITVEELRVLAMIETEYSKYQEELRSRNQ